MVHISIKDIFLVLAVVVTWGAHPTIIKFGIEEMEPLLLASFRFGLTALLFVPFVRRVDWSAVPVLMGIGVLFMGMNMGGIHMALDRITASSFIVIVMCAIPVTILCDRLFFGKKFGLYTAIGIAIAFAGMVMIYGAPDIANAPMGFFYACVSIAGWVSGSLLMRRSEPIDLPFFSVVTGFTGSAVLLIWSFLVEQNQMQQITGSDWSVLGLVLAYQVLILGVITYVWRGLMARNPSELVTPFLLLQVPVGIFVASLFLMEVPSLETLIGGALIVFGVALIHVRKYWHYKRSLDKGEGDV